MVRSICLRLDDNTLPLQRNALQTNARRSP